MINSLFSTSKDSNSFASIGKLPWFDDPFANISSNIFDNFLPIKTSKMISLRYFLMRIHLKRSIISNHIFICYILGQYNQIHYLIAITLVLKLKEIRFSCGGGSFSFLLSSLPVTSESSLFKFLFASNDIQYIDSTQNSTQINKKWQQQQK